RRSRRTSTDNVLEISWDTDSLCSFVAGQYFTAGGADLSRELSSIIGIEVVKPTGRSATAPEPLTNYLLRHTSGTPRELHILIKAALTSAARVSAQRDTAATENAIR